MTTGEKIKVQRKKRGLSQESVADLIGVSRQAVTKWESGRSLPSSENLITLAAVFDVPLEDLAGDVPAEKKPNEILRTNLTTIAIILQAGALHSCTQVTYHLDIATGTKTPDRGFFLFQIFWLFLCSVWMSSNLRFEKDLLQRRKNARIELAYCIIQLLGALATIRFSLGFVGLLYTLSVLLIYILVINPKYMNRRLTK